MPADIQSVIDRILHTMLEPPTYQPIRAWLIADVTTVGQDTVQLGNFSVAEDQQLLRNGIVIELGYELMLVKGIDDVNAASPTLTVERGAYGTEAATYVVGQEIRLSPLFTKQSVFEAVRDNIITLHPRLFTVKVEYAAQVSPGIYACSDDLAISVESAWPYEASFGTMDITADIIDYHPTTEGRAFRAAGFVGNLWIRYRRRMETATATTDLLDDLGVDEAWVNIIMAGAVADVIVGRDVPETIVDWISKSIDTEAVPVGTRQSLAIGLRRYRDYLIDGFSREMTAEYKKVAVRRNPYRKVGRL
jgi:hypothetical protein